ncbi:hypothetical protein TWF696_002109 [Orbilia brochopaga]|uniref:Uncharacterized protein n=1 Tax=Orbilia brochopaga TaxID=3140254 RepID=A0AAV9U7D3_9PEZI
MTKNPVFDPSELENSTVAVFREEFDSEESCLSNGDEQSTEPISEETLELRGEDPPEPGSVYIISESDTSNVITNESGRINLSEFGGVPKKSQKWVCCRSGGWLGFTNDAGDATVYLGHDIRGVLICTATWHLPWEHFCVRKRAAGGFEILMRHWLGMQPVGHRYDGALLGKREDADTWWNFTKVG